MATLINERYEIKKTVNQQTARIFVEINADDEVTIQTEKSHPQLVFTRSNKDLVKAMGMALQEAAELVDSRKVTAG